MVRLVFACLLMCLARAEPALASGSIPNVVDADTIYLNGERVRLQGIDAPETDQTCLNATGQPFKCGLEARTALETRFGNRPWTCRPFGKDRYDRTLAKCSVDGQDVARWLVREGWALAFRRYSTDYVQDETAARDAHSGLWKGSFIAPWDWRQRSPTSEVLGAKSVSIDASRALTGASAAPPSPSCVIKGNLRGKTCIYHIPTGRYYDRLDMANKATRRWFCSEADAQAAGCRRSKL
ncbi:thermonuclease family protein [Afipia massiliensis]|uniref:Thermonuclease family protein n=2 Tax=Afipia massiliensis TaxID=211460 RepID=A0A4U6BKU2_9BRAD|nr:thermonuclease family protein [Afipia massiliensis]